MAKLNIRTLNGIRTAPLPSGRDVAEAFDDIVAELARVSPTIPQSGPSAPTPNTQAPKTAPAKPVSPISIGQPVPSNGQQGVTSFTGDGTVLSNSASTGSVVAALEAVAPNAFLGGPEFGSSDELPTYRYIETADLPIGGTWNFIGIISGAFNLQGIDEAIFNPASGAPASATTAGTAGQMIYYNGVLYFCSVTGSAGHATWNSVNLTAV
jgi:hypothetical protein